MVEDGREIVVDHEMPAVEIDRAQRFVFVRRVAARFIAVEIGQLRAVPGELKRHDVARARRAEQFGERRRESRCASLRRRGEASALQSRAAEMSGAIRAHRSRSRPAAQSGNDRSPRTSARLRPPPALPRPVSPAVAADGLGAAGGRKRSADLAAAAAPAPALAPASFPRRLSPRSSVPVNGVTSCPRMRCATLCIVGASLLKPPCVREVVAERPVCAFETDQITSPAPPPLSVEIEEPLELRVVADRFLEPEDRRLPLRLERVVDEIEERLAIDRKAVVIELEVARHREDAEVLDAFARRRFCRGGCCSKVSTRIAGARKWRLLKCGDADLQRRREEVRVKDRARAVANRVQFDAILELRLLAELLQLARGIARAALGVRGALRAHFHPGPDLHSADAAGECLERKIRRRGKVDRALAVRIQELAERFQQAGLPDEVDRISAVLEPPLHLLIGGEQPGLLRGQSAVRVEDDRQLLPVAAARPFVQVVLEDRIHIGGRDVWNCRSWKADPG